MTPRQTFEAIKPLPIRWLAIYVIVLWCSGCASPNIERAPAPQPDRASSTLSEHIDRKEAPHSLSEHLSMAAIGLQKALQRVYHRWVGTPYRYGGQSRNGVDCSSFVQQTFDTVESFELPRTAVQQARVGLSIPRSNLRTGDLVFFKTGRLSRHVGIYLGEGRFMHASSSQGVTISRLDNIYWRRHYWQSRRILADTQRHDSNSNL